MHPEIDIETLRALRWSKLEPRDGNYEDCNAQMVLRHACDLMGRDEPHSIQLDVPGWCRIDSERTAFRVYADDTETVWIVTMDHDGAPDGHSVAKRVEVIRC